ncbi:Elongator subunit elp4 [Thoreauomyces humboldtii]|nr:Elongator subunit elp4 [Thoreauomyces humboldtii]
MSSFKRRTPTTLASLPATRISAHNSSVLTSTGVPSIDELLGGGLPLHCSLLVLEDRFTGYAKLLQSYYIAQGIASGHAVCLATAEEEPETLVRGLMAVVEGKVPSEMKEEEDDLDDAVSPGVGIAGRRMGAVREEEDRMRIAWRYQGLPKFSQAVGLGRRDADSQHPFCNLFDLTKRITPATLNAAGPRMALLDVSQWAIEAEEHGEKSVFHRLIEYIEGLVDEGGFRIRPNAPPPPTVLRIAIHSLASPIWGDASSSQIAQFLHSLRAVLRTSYATAIVTLPHTTPATTATIASHLSDAVIALDSFAGRPVPVHPAFESQYHGFLDVIKVPRVGCLGARRGEIAMLGFKVRRKRFLVERCSLPPEGEADAEDVKRHSHAKPGCGSAAGSSGSNPLDF